MKKAFLLLILLMVFASIASADTLNLADPWWGYGENVNVNMVQPNSNPVYAGQIMVTLNASPANDSPAFAVYCLDLLSKIESPQTVEVKSLQDFGDTGGKIAWLLNTYAFGVDSNAKGAGLQLAIWEVLYDTQYDLSDGTFKVLSNNIEAITQAGNYLGSIGSNTSNAIWFDTNAGQDLGAPIPEPGSLLLLSTGLGALGFAFLRRRKST